MVKSCLLRKETAEVTLINSWANSLMSKLFKKVHVRWNFLGFFEKLLPSFTIRRKIKKKKLSNSFQAPAQKSVRTPLNCIYPIICNNLGRLSLSKSSSCSLLDISSKRPVGRRLLLECKYLRESQSILYLPVHLQRKTKMSEAPPFKNLVKQSGNWAKTYSLTI